LALKSAAVSEANAVASNAGASPTVATICPVRSTISAVRALDSPRKPLRIVWMLRKSSSRKVQLEAPLMLPASCERRFQPADDRLRPAAQPGLSLPGQVIAKQPDRLDA